MELSFKDIVKIFAVREEIVNDWIEKKRMPCIKVNEQYRFNYIELLDWALQKKIDLTPEALALATRSIIIPAFCIRRSTMGISIMIFPAMTGKKF